MSSPILEIALAPIKGKTIDDESTSDGEIWREIFSHVTNIPGLIRASWGLNGNNRDMNFFLVGVQPHLFDGPSLQPARLTTVQIGSPIPTTNVSWMNRVLCRSLSWIL